ncbi:MAG: fatty acid cis/trans isomerase [Cellvibrionaceae bacterium]
MKKNKTPASKRYIRQVITSKYQFASFMKKLAFFLIVISILSGCATFIVSKFDALYGDPKPRERVVESLADGDIDYWTEVKPILDNRCVVCHGCYDAPCQLKLTAPEGIDRGAHKTSVYNTGRLLPASLTRLFEDASTVDEWRDKNFFPVLNEHIQSTEANIDASVLHQLLVLKEQHPLPNEEILSDEFSFGVSRKESCPRPEEIDKYKKDKPLWGMPYAMPGLNSNEQNTLKRWVEQGGKYTARTPLAKSVENEITKWESLLNQNSLKSQLINRYIYEHLFLAHLYFEEAQGEVTLFFKLVRSSTPPGQPVKRISTRRPYDDPGVNRVYYRIVPELETIVAKSHMPYALGQNRMQRWEELFYHAEFEVDSLPSYASKENANPFIVYSQLPMKSRYKFMLDEAQFTIMNYIKGPVCRGSVALNVINDHFWVFFLDPDISLNENIEEITSINSSDLELPSAVEDSYVPLVPWKKYAAMERRNRARRDEFVTQYFSGKKIKLDETLIWDGDGHNPNAALTIFRHWDSATVEKGLVGENPKTAWVISYPLLERIHYLLVAGYDVYGNLGHNLLSRLHMDFLRMDGEAAFLMMLPQASREKERALWYRGASTNVLDYLSNPNFEKNVEPSIQYTSDDHKLELYRRLKERLSGALPRQRSIEEIDNKSIRVQLKRLERFNGANTRFFPEMSVIEIVDPRKNKPYYATILKNNGHLNITSLLRESKKLLPQENTMTVVNGFLGAYPNLFFKVNTESIDDFVDQSISLSSEKEFRFLLDKYGVRRTNKEFWSHSDSLHQSMKESLGAEFGYFDYNRLENR